MTKLEQAAQQALEALETDEQWGFVNKKVLERRLPAITALREALAEQAEQSQLADASLEPVAWLVQYKDCHTFVWGRKPEFIVDGVVEPLYAAPVRTKDLTDDEIEAIMVEQGDLRTTAFARAVIAADREKNK